MKYLLIFGFFVLIVSNVLGDIRIRRRREVEKEESKEEVVIKNGNNSMEVDVECDDKGRDIVKLFFDNGPLMPFGDRPDSGIFDIFNRMREMAQAFSGDFQRTVSDLPVVSNDTKTEVIERNGMKFLQTSTTIKRGNNQTMMVTHSSHLKPLDGQDPNEYVVDSPNQPN